jgi:Protein of unknown function (DUF2848)
MSALTLQLPEGRTLEFEARTLVVVGFSGRDQADVERHIAELEALGVTRPPEIPTFYVLPPSILTHDARIAVDSAQSSGEVEPVLFCTPEGRFVGLGSDHTARDLERESIELSKRACPKVVAREVMPYEDAVAHWDELVLSCRVGEERAPYQDGVAGELLPIPELMDRLIARTQVGLDGLVVFLGTLPLVSDGFMFSDRYELEMRLPSNGVALSCRYDVQRRENGRMT